MLRRGLVLDLSIAFGKLRHGELRRFPTIRPTPFSVTVFEYRNSTVLKLPNWNLPADTITICE